MKAFFLGRALSANPIKNSGRQGDFPWGALLGGARKNTACGLFNITRAAGRLGELAAYDARLRVLADQIESIDTQLTDTVGELQRYCDNYTLEPDELERIDQRLRVLHDAGRKYRVAPESLKSLCEDLAQELLKLSTAINTPDALEKQLHKALPQYD